MPFTKLRRRYALMSDLVDHFFPPLPLTGGPALSACQFCCAGDYASSTYWREPLPDIASEIELFVKTREAEKKSEKKTVEKKTIEKKTVEKKPTAVDKKILDKKAAVDRK